MLTLAGPTAVLRHALLPPAAATTAAALLRAGQACSLAAPPAYAPPIGSTSSLAGSAATNSAFKCAASVSSTAWRGQGIGAALGAAAPLLVEAVLGDVRQWGPGDIPDQTGRHIIITGGTSGIGLEAAKALYRRNATVLITGRNEEKARAVVDHIKHSVPSTQGQLEYRQCNLASFRSIHDFSEGYLASGSPLHVMIANAGVFMPPHSRTEEGFEVTVGTNYWGHFYLLHRLLPALRKAGSAYALRRPPASGSGTRDPLAAAQQGAPPGSKPGARVVLLSSILEQLGDVPWGDLTGQEAAESDIFQYGRSKPWNIMLGQEAQRRLGPTSTSSGRSAGSGAVAGAGAGAGAGNGTGAAGGGAGIDFFAVHPGVAGTEAYPKADAAKLQAAVFRLATAAGGRQPAGRGALSMLYCATAPELMGQGGGYYGPHFDGLWSSNTFNTHRCWPGNRLAYDREAQRRLYDASLAPRQPGATSTIHLATDVGR